MNSPSNSASSSVRLTGISGYMISDSRRTGRRCLVGVARGVGYTDCSLAVAGAYLPYISRIVCYSRVMSEIGTVSTGDGKTFPRNPRSDEMLNRLASELVSADKDR